MAILVLGGAGYIGSHTVYELIDAGREVVVADNLQTGFRAAVHPKAKFYQLDIRDKGALDTLFQAEKIDGVIHFAASSQVGESMSDPLKYYDYIHVNDLAQAHILALDYLMQGGENNVFNLGNGVGFTVKEVVDVARAVTGHPIPAKVAPRRAGDPAQLIASSEKAIRVLGWKPQYNDLNTIVASAWAWHKSHPHGFEEE